ncbi:unnamed protein product [Linum trigynum]|uniref:Uncharacterized protein n=1 Tax=Linum trigynum TaxID=586398 RepID=A0AAV2F6Q5_9ROSI
MDLGFQVLRWLLDEVVLGFNGGEYGGNKNSVEENLGGDEMETENVLSMKWKQRRRRRRAVAVGSPFLGTCGLGKPFLESHSSSVSLKISQ